MYIGVKRPGAGKKIKSGEVTVLEAVEACLGRMKEMEPGIHAYVTVVDEEQAMERAKEVQAMIEEGALTSPLAGVPVAVKDNLCTKGLRTTCSSEILYNFVPTYTAEAVLNLEKAGAVILGRPIWMSLPWGALQRHRLLG